MINEHNRFAKWNKNFESVSGYSAKEMAKISPLDLFFEDDKERVAEKIKEVFVNGKSDVEADLVTKKGKKIPYYFNGRKTKLENKIYLLGMGIDISKQKKAEEYLKNKNSDLERINKATIDRELKMIELKKQIGKSKE